MNLISAFYMVPVSAWIDMYWQVFLNYNQGPLLSGYTLNINSASWAKLHKAFRQYVLPTNDQFIGSGMFVSNERNFVVA